MINTDKPINKIADDKLERAEFVKRVSKAIYGFKSTDNIAIALQGKWGCGKTSILNMIHEEISMKSKDTIIVNFNPWNFTDCNQLINQFFINLSSELKRQDDNKEVKTEDKKAIGAEIGRVIEKYSYALEYAKYIPVIGKYLEIIPQLAGSVGAAIKEDEDSRKNDIIYQKNTLIRMLKESTSRILIIIDDIDRLPKEQIRLIFQLVCSVADFPNTTYLLSYDKAVVVKALNDVQGENGEDYLEKIIQMSFDIPNIKSNMLYDLLIEKIKETIVLPEGELDSEYWHSVFYSCIMPFITSARSVIRYVNILSFAYLPVKDEVCFSDMAAICSFQLFATPIYEWIKNSKYTLAGGYNGGGILNNKVGEKKKEYIEFFEKIYNGNIDTIISSLSILFPKFKNQISYSSCFITPLELRKYKRIASTERFDVYFSLCLEDVKISDSEFLMSINEMDEEELEEYLSLIKAQNLLSEYKNELMLYSNEIKEDRIELLLSKLMFSSGRIETGEQLLGYDEQTINVYFLIDLLKSVKKEEYRYKLIKNIMNHSDFISFPKLLHLPHILELNYGKIAKTEYIYDEKLINEEHFAELESIILERIEELSEKQNIFECKECIRTLLLWEVIECQSYCNYVKDKIKSPINAIIMASFAVVEWSSVGVIAEYEYKEMSYYNYKDFLDDDILLGYIVQERKNQDFWKLEISSIKKAIAFYIMKKEPDSNIIDAELVENKYEEWHNEFINQQN